MCPTNAGGKPSILAFVPERGVPEELVANGRNPVVTSDDRTIVYITGGRGSDSGVWRVDADGRNKIHLATGAASSPVLTPDDRYVIYMAGTEQYSLNMVPLAGGTPREIVAGPASAPVVRSDGKLSFATIDEQHKDGVRVVCDLPACTSASRQYVESTPTTGTRMPDGSGVAYVDQRTPNNIWVQPSNGSAAYPLTQFTAGTINGFVWSRDGKRLVVTRNNRTTDIVLFRNIHR